MEITIHTERLHDDRVWARVVAFVAFLEKREISATWFSINPTALPYRQMGFDEVKWKERLRYLTSHGQRIEQHTHFYASGKGPYNLSPAHVTRCLDEDRAWLAKEGYIVTRFVSGGWRMTADIRDILRAKGYTDSTEDKRTLSPRAAVTRILSGRAGTLPPLLYLHDYELANPLIAFLVRRAVVYWRARPFPVVIHPHDHKRARDWQKILFFISSFFKGNEIHRILELGAGTGNIAAYFAGTGASVTAEDVNGDYLRTVRDRDPRIAILEHDINLPLPFSDGHFDVVFCIGVLHYASVRSIESVLAEMTRVSSRYLVIDLFPKYSLYGILERIVFPRFHPRRFSAGGARALFRGAGISPVAELPTRAPLNKSAVYILQKNNA